MLMGRQCAEKLHCLYGNPTAHIFFQKLDSRQLMNRKVKILGKSFYSPSLKDVGLESFHDQLRF